MFKIDADWETEATSTLAEDDETPVKGLDEGEKNNETNKICEINVAKQIKARTKRQRQMKNKRRCKNKFKPNNGKIVDAVKKALKDPESNKNLVATQVIFKNVEKPNNMKDNSSKKYTEVLKEQQPQPVLNEKEQSNKEVPKSLNDKLSLKLKASRFRYLNEQLYTCHSKEAQTLFKNDPEAFKIYHEGFVNQVKKWPVKPLELIIQWVLSKPKNLVIADLGCGEAILASKVKHKVHSFDLVALNNRVTVCDIADVPLAKESVDVVVFCLALMGTNCQQFLVEANRILKDKGILKIAEVASRFKSTKMFINDMKSIGFFLKKKDLSNSHFYTFDFVKGRNLTGKITKVYKGLQLQACLYKKR